MYTVYLCLCVCPTIIIGPSHPDTPSTGSFNHVEHTYSWRMTEKGQRGKRGQPDLRKGTRGPD